MVGILALLLVIGTGYALLARVAAWVFERSVADSPSREPGFWEIVQ